MISGTTGPSVPIPSHPGFASGRYIDIAELNGPVRPSLGPSSAATAGRVYYFPFKLTQPMSISEVHLQITTGGGNLRIGIYANSYSTCKPTGSPLIDSGVIDVSGTGDKSAAFVITLQPGWYWVALHTSGTPAWNGYSAGGLQMIGSSTAADATQYEGWIETKAFGALAAPGTLTEFASVTTARVQFKIA